MQPGDVIAEVNNRALPLDMRDDELFDMFVEIPRPIAIGIRRRSAGGSHDRDRGGSRSRSALEPDAASDGVSSFHVSSSHVSSRRSAGNPQSSSPRERLDESYTVGSPSSPLERIHAHMETNYKHRSPSTDDHADQLVSRGGLRRRC